MADAAEKLRLGDISGARTALLEHVRKNPADSRLRVFLFQLFALTGDWARARNQLKILHELDPSHQGLVVSYNHVLACEEIRQSVFRGEIKPTLFGEPPPWTGYLIAALVLQANGKPTEAKTLREQAFDDCPGLSGSINGRPFDWIFDSDSRLGPVLEVYLSGSYYWVPFAAIRSIEIEQPQDLRDLVWCPASFEWINNGKAVGFIPARYDGSEVDSDPQIQLGRKTDWIELANGHYKGLGLRSISTSDEDVPLFEVRSLKFDDVEAATKPETATDR